MELSLKDRIQLGEHLAEDERLEELRQQYETVLGLLESAFLTALVTGNWTEFDQFVEDFKCTTKTEGVDAAVELKTPSSIPNPTTTQMIED